MGARKREALEQFNRDNILTAAKELFETKGIEKTTMDDIAELADYSKSTIYVYFKSKEDIYNSIVIDYMAMLIGDLNLCVDGTEDFKESFHRVCHCLASFEEKYPKYYSSLMGEENMTNSRKESKASSRRTRVKKEQNGIEEDEKNPEINEVLRRLLLKGQKSKQLRKDLDLEATVLYVWSAVSGIIQVAERRKNEIQARIKKSKQEYLDYSFQLFYESLIKK